MPVGRAGSVVVKHLHGSPRGSGLFLPVLRLRAAGLHSLAENGSAGEDQQQEEGNVKRYHATCFL